MSVEATTQTLPAGATHHAIPLFDAARPGWIDPTDQRPDAVARRYLEMLEAATGALHRIVRLLARPTSAPTLVHCAAGRDRTGIVTAALLAAVDVDHQAISIDFALTADSIGAERVTAEAMMALLQLVEQTHGGMKRFLIQEAHCNPQTISAIRAALLETSSGGRGR